jgi:molybdenum cofactor cytidylyltransferase
VIAAAILAAGEGRRFGGVKQLHDVDGVPMLERVLAVVAGAGIGERIVVLGAHAGEILATVDLHGARAVVCETWRDGQAASLRAGIAAVGQASAAIVWLGDQPLINAVAVDRVVRARGTSEADVTRASYGGRPGHPVCFERTLFARLHALRGDEGAKTVLRGLPQCLVECADVAWDGDVDTPEDLKGLAS